MRNNPINKGFGKSIEQIGKDTPQTKTGSSNVGTVDYILDLIKARFGSAVSIKPFNFSETTQTGGVSAINSLLKDATNKQKAVFFGTLTFSVFDMNSAPAMSYARYTALCDESLNSVNQQTPVNIAVVTPCLNFTPASVKDILLTSVNSINNDVNFVMTINYSGFIVQLS